MTSKLPLSHSASSNVKWPAWVSEATENCGIAALLALFRLERKAVNTERLRADIRVVPDGASLQDLVKAARNQGLDARPLEVSPNRLTSNRVPCIALLKDETGKPNHYVVVYSAHRDAEFRLLDAVSGNLLNLSPEEFAKRFTGFILSVEHGGSHDIFEKVLVGVVGTEIVALAILVGWIRRQRNAPFN